MPIVGGVFVPRGSLCAAEREVDWPGVYNHVSRRRVEVERAGALAARRLAAAYALTGYSPASAEGLLERRLASALEATVRYGFVEVRRELVMLRARGSVAAYEVPDAGEHGSAAAQGLDAILSFVRRRARGASRRVAHAVAAITQTEDWPALSGAQRLEMALAAARRSLHTNAIELVGEALNLGRSAGAQSLSSPPRYALRSEQLDSNTCSVCHGLQGEIVQIATSEYYRLMPPAMCLGGGRCRGILVYGDGESQLSLPRAA